MDPGLPPKPSREELAALGQDREAVADLVLMLWAKVEEVSALLAARGEEVRHNDESGLSVLGKTAWLHVACTGEWTYFDVTAGRGFEDIRSLGVFEGYKGRPVRDSCPPTSSSTRCSTGCAMPTTGETCA